jgi:formylglycine-generating enzyme
VVSRASSRLPRELGRFDHDLTGAMRRAIGSPSRDMVWVPGVTFQMGSNDFCPEERPAHSVTVDGFWMDAHPVTNAEFRRFRRATG